MHALKSGFDGVFIAGCGGDCAYVPDCTARTSAVVKQAQAALKEAGLNPKRLKMSALCSVCAEPFVAHMSGFQKELVKIAAS